MLRLYRCIVQSARLNSYRDLNTERRECHASKADLLLLSPHLVTGITQAAAAAAACY
jgi:hypothetical protein